jgi:outer membrane protein insertion porin family
VIVERPSIGSVRFEGHDAVEEEKLRETVDLREGAVLNESAVRRNVQRLRDLYAEKGYFLSEIRYELVRRTDADNESDVVFRIRENAQVQVRAVNFVGNQNITDDELRGSIQTQAAGFFSFLTSTGTYREETFRNDIDLLHAAYYDRGYLNVEIGTPRIALSADRRWLDVTLPVREGPRYRVGRLQIQEVDDDANEIEPLGGRRRVREMLHFNPGDWFSRQTIGRDILALQTYYRDAGYANVEVRPDVQPRTDRQSVDLTFRVQRGALTTIHRIVIRGNTKTADRVIRRELAIVEGERYNETRYQDSRRRAMALGFFERVDLSTETVEGRPDRVIVNVEVTEKPTGRFRSAPASRRSRRSSSRRRFSSRTCSAAGRASRCKRRSRRCGRSSRFASSSRTCSTRTGRRRWTSTTRSARSRTSAARPRAERSRPAIPCSGPTTFASRSRTRPSTSA